MPEPRHPNPRCREQLKAAVSARIHYRRLWPEHCTTCSGVGMLRVTDSLSQRVGGTAITSTEECPLCLGISHCPRCRTEGIGPGAHIVCNHCGWTLGCPGEPELPPCTCKPEAAHG